MRTLLVVQLISVAFSAALASTGGAHSSAKGSIRQRDVLPSPVLQDAPKDIDLSGVGQSKKCSVNGSALCSSDAPNAYWACMKGKWASMKCSGKSVCAQTDDTTVVCHDPNSPVTHEQQESIPCKTNNSTMCNSADNSGFYVCIKNVWTLEKCSKGNMCRIVDNAAICVPPNTPTKEPEQSCSKPNESKCDASNPANFFVCTKNKWEKMECDGDNVCMARDGKTSCVDKATADAPVQPCTQDKATRCVDDNKDIFQVCQNKYWTNSTCSSGNVCGTKQGSAICHDPKQPIIDVPDQPCAEKSPNRCVPGNNTLYQICYNKLWSNNTCPNDDVCIIINKAAACVDKNVALSISPTNTLRQPEVFVADDSHAASRHGMYSWGVGSLLCAVAIAFGFGF